MKTALEWYRELYQRSGGATEADIAAIQADALDGLRDRVAASALAGLLANRTPSLWTEGEAIRKMESAALADFAYTLADAMMARRATQPTTGAPAPTTKGQ